MIASSEVGESYERDLRAYIANPTEEGLAAAYQDGRTALGGGIGLVAFAELHSRVFAKVGHADLDAPVAANLAANFFAEAMATYEMAFRGYQESNAALEHANEQLSASNQELEAFGYSISHDLRAPLRAMAGFAGRLRERTTVVDPEVSHFADRIIANAQRMGLLVDHLLMLSRLSRRELEKELVNPSTAAGRALDELDEVVTQNHAKVVIEEMADCVGDPKLLQQVYANLLGNALKYSRHNEHPLVEVGSTNNQQLGVVYYVRDNGAGFDMRYRDKLFGAFQRLHTDSEFEGTGVGLAIVQRIVTRHGGEVFAIGAVGKGATFSFTLGSP
jgi:two-component system, sensor histidine kinase and response regulator